MPRRDRLLLAPLVGAALAGLVFVGWFVAAGGIPDALDRAESEARVAAMQEYAAELDVEIADLERAANDCRNLSTEKIEECRATALYGDHLAAERQNKLWYAAFTFVVTLAVAFGLGAIVGRIFT